jgi:hypothetical protein
MEYDGYDRVSKQLNKFVESAWPIMAARAMSVIVVSVVPLQDCLEDLRDGRRGSASSNQLRCRFKCDPLP